MSNEYEIKRTDEEINAVIDTIITVKQECFSKWRGMSYEDGVRAGIEWVIGEVDDNPMED